MQSHKLAVEKREDPWEKWALDTERHSIQGLKERIKQQEGEMSK